MSSPAHLCAGKAAGGTSNLAHAPSLEITSIVICALLAALTLLFAVPRIYVNRRQLMVADYFTIIALVFNIAFAVVIFLEAQYYRNGWSLPFCWIDLPFIKLQFSASILFGFVLFFPRAAIFLLYRQLFQVHNNHVRVAVCIGLVFSFLLSAPQLPLAILFLAPHPGETWEQMLARVGSTPLKGYSWRVLGPVQGASSVALDIFAFVLPLPIIFRLSLASRKKTQLLLLFSTALLGILASIFGLVYKLKQYVKNFESEGYSMWLQGPVNMCTYAEASIAIVVGSMPAFANFMKVHVLGSGPSQTMKSWFKASDGSNDPDWERNRAPQPVHGTIGSPPRRKYRPADYGLMDTHMMSLGSMTGGKEVSENLYSLSRTCSYEHGCQTRLSGESPEFQRQPPISKDRIPYT